MNGKAHLATGLAAGTAYAGAFGQPLLLAAPCGLIAGFASLAPDLDLEHAMLSARLPWLSWVVRRFSFGHRGLTHLVPLWVSVAVVSIALVTTAASRARIPWLVSPVAAFWVGYFCHLAQDAMTKDGVPMIPLMWTHWHITPCRWMHFRADGLFSSCVAGVMVLMFVGVTALAYVPGVLPLAGVLPLVDSGVRAALALRQGGR